MNKICLSFLVVTALSRSASGQKVEVQKPDRGQILHVQTALNHLTVLEMTEPVSTELRMRKRVWILGSGVQFAIVSRKIPPFSAQNRRDL